MRTRRALLAVLLPAACLLLGDDCYLDPDRAAARRERETRDAAAEDPGGVSLDENACLLLSAPLPMGLSLVPGAPDRVLAGDPKPAVLAIDATVLPPALAGRSIPSLPASTLDGIVGLAPDLALVTDRGATDQVIFVDAARGATTQVQIGGAMRNVLSTTTSVTFPAGAVDSTGATPPDPSDTSDTSGAAALEGLLFVSMGNGSWTAVLPDPDPTYLPGVVLVFDMDLSGDVPVLSGNPPLVLFTTGFHPSSVTPYVSPGGRSFVLVTTTGALATVGTRLDFAPSAQAAAREGYVEVIEVFPDEDPAFVAVIPLGATAPALGRIAIDPSGRIGALGSLVGVSGGGSALARRVLAVDLAPLDALPAEPPDTPAVLDGSGGNPDALIADESLGITPIAGAPASTACSGSVVATAWTPDGRLLAAELCDGTVSSWQVDLEADPPDFALRAEETVVAPYDPPPTADLNGPVDLIVRPEPGAGEPDVFLLLAFPTGNLCAFGSAAF